MFVPRFNPIALRLGLQNYVRRRYRARRRGMICGNKLAEYGGNKYLWNISAMAETILTHSYISRVFSYLIQIRLSLCSISRGAMLLDKPTLDSCSSIHRYHLARSEILLLPAPHSVIREIGTSTSPRRIPFKVFEAWIEKITIR